MPSFIAAVALQQLRDMEALHHELRPARRSRPGPRSRRRRLVSVALPRPVADRLRPLWRHP